MTETQDPVTGESLPPATGDQVAQAVDVQVLVQYLRTVVPALLEEDDVLHPSFKQCLQDPAALDKLKKFICDPQTKAVLIQRASVKGIVSLCVSGDDDSLLFVLVTQRMRMMPKVRRM